MLDKNEFTENIHITFSHCTFNGCTPKEIKQLISEIIYERTFIDELKETIRKFREQHKADGFSYFICATNGAHTNAFSSVDAAGNELMAFLASAMRQNKNVEDCILWLADHYKQLNKIVEDGFKHN